MYPDMIKMMLLASALVIGAPQLAGAVKPIHSKMLEPVPAAYNIWHPDAKEEQDIKSGKVAFLHKSSKKCKGAKACKDDDDDDFVLPDSFFKPVVPKQDFKMDEASTILFQLMDQMVKPSYLQFATSLAKEHKLSEGSKAKTVTSLRESLAEFHKGGHDYMLDASVDTNPQMPADLQRTRFMQMLNTMLEHATAEKPPAVKRQPMFRRASK